MSPARFRWGILFILIGGLRLSNNIGWLDWWIWADIISLWPLILIAIGVEKIFTRSRLEVISYLAPLALAAVVLWVAWDGLSLDARPFSKGDRSSYRIERDVDLERLTIDFDLNDCDLNLKSSPRYLFNSRFDGFNSPPDVDYDDEAGIGYIKVKARNTWGILRYRSRDDDLDVHVANDIPLSIKCFSDDGNMKLDCRALNLENLDIDSRNGNIKIYLGNRSENVRVNLEGGDDADFRLNIPPDCGLRIDGELRAAVNRLRRLSLEDNGSYFITSGFDTLSPQIKINLGPDVSRLSIDYY